MKNFLIKNRVFILCFILMTPVILFAADPLPGGTVSGSGGTGLNPIKSQNLGELLIAIFDALIAIGIPVAILMLVYSGFLFVSAMGEEKQVNNAKENLKWTVIGIAVLLGAKAIVLMVQTTVASL